MTVKPSRRLALGGLAALAAGPALAAPPRRKRPPTPNPEVLPIRIGRGLPWTAVQVDGGEARPWGFNIANHDWYAHPSIVDPKYVPTGSRASSRHTLGKVLIGGRLIDSNVPCVAWPQAFEGQPIVGWIGLRRYEPLLLDWDARTMTVNAPTPAGWRPARFDGLTQTSTVIRAVIDGRPARLALSTFLTWGLELADHYVKAHGLWDRQPRRRTDIDADGRVIQQSVILDRVEVAGLGFDNVVARLFNRERAYNHGKHDADGIIGFDMLRRLNLHIDQRGFAERGVAFQYSRQKDEPWADDRAGMVFKAYGSELQVALVDEQGAAFKAGVRAGDTLIDAEVEGSIEGLPHALTRPAGTQVPLDVQRGERRLRLVVTLEDRL